MLPNIGAIRMYFYEKDEQIIVCSQQTSGDKNAYKEDKTFDKYLLKTQRYLNKPFVRT